MQASIHHTRVLAVRCRRFTEFDHVVVTERDGSHLELFTAPGRGAALAKALTEAFAIGEAVETPEAEAAE